MRILAGLILSSVIIISGACSNCKKTVNNHGTDRMVNQLPPNVIGQNLSIVTAEILEVEEPGAESFRIKARILSAEEHESFPNIAAPGNDYTLVPGLQYSENVLSDSEINKSLLNLSKQQPGTRFEAEIYLDHKLGWVIQKVLN